MSPAIHQHPSTAGPGAKLPAPRRLTLLLLIPAVLLTAVAMVLLWPHDPPDAVDGGPGPTKSPRTGHRGYAATMPGPARR